ncbi:MAG: 30S ribosomal protein S4 [Candidatus Zambryskibacteria bacterium]|nr:30S ribosomal protein S4 [Candidatus Zambryskibacteria bacterium]
MRIGPKYKIARRLGAPVFEKTQTPKYVLSLARKEKSGTGRSKPKSEFGRELTEKQKAKFTYGLNERQFRVYVDKAARTKDPVQKLFAILESRLDNILFRSGLAKTRSAARQMASHGHILINNKRVTIPSIILREGNVVSIRASSASSNLFSEAEERMKTLAAPAWLKIEPKEKTVAVTGMPVYNSTENLFDLGIVIEFYNR